MKKTILFSALLFLAFSSFSQTYVNGYYKSNGTYVNGYNKTESNNTNWDNYSTKGNTNPYTQESGTKPRDYSTESSNYSSDKTIYEGPNGGQYYINSNGNKTYVPKTSSTFGY